MNATKLIQLEQLRIEIETGLIDDEECARRMDEIGVSEDELDEFMDRA